jgi:VanZ family protein
MPTPVQDGTAILWPRPLTRLPVAVLVIAVLLSALAVLYVEVPGRPLILHALQKMGHPIVFGVMTACLFGLRRQIRSNARPPADYSLVLLCGLLAGVLTELGQVITHRDPALKDVLLDLRGIACALALFAVCDPRLSLRGSRPVARNALLASSVVLIGLTVSPALWVSTAYLARQWQAPVLFRPHSALDLLLVSLTDTAPELAPLPAGFARLSGERGLKVPLTTRPYAGVVLDEPLADWRGYRELNVDVVNPAHTELALHLRIQDRAHNGLFDDRYEGQVRIPAQSRQQVHIPLAAIAAAPRSRALDLAHIGPVMLYKVGAEGPREFWLGTVALR